MAMHVVTVLAADISTISSSSLQESVALFPEVVRARMLDLGNEKDRVRSCTGMILLRKGLPEEEKQVLQTIAYDNNGKPYFPGSAIHFNISHSGNFVVCCISLHGIPLGIDTEFIRAIEISSFSRILTAREAMATDNMKCLRSFYRIWTSKESVSKLLGVGLKARLDRIHTFTDRAFYNSQQFFLTELFTDHAENVTTLATNSIVEVTSVIVAELITE